MRPSTRSAGKPNTPIRSEARMTRLVTLSRARPRKPLTSPAAIQRGARTSAGGEWSRAPGARKRRPPRAPAEPIAAPGSGGGCAVAGRWARAGGAAGSAFVGPAPQALLAAFPVDEGCPPALLAEVADAPALFQ